MDTNKLYIQKLHEDAILPVKGTALSAGYDLHAYTVDKNITVYNSTNTVVPKLMSGTSLILFPNIRALIPTGLSVACHPEYCIKVYPRSGCVKQGFTQPNCVGIIDADYRGEVHVLVHNISSEYIEIDHGQRIAQLMLEKVEPIEFVVVNKLPASESNRGTGGFGSTGV